MSKSQRTKGAAYEREICTDLAVYFGRPVLRHIGQARDGGNDITLGPLVLECKRRKSLKTLSGWLNQAKAAMQHMDDIPAVVMRADDEESMVLLRFSDFLLLCEEEVEIESG